LLYRGEIAARDTKLLTAAFACGLLRDALAEEINLVNAEVMLRERGIELIEESNTDMGAFRSTMTVEIAAADVKQRVTGTLFGNNMPRLVAVDEQRLEAYLDGTMLLFKHHDEPGIIGAVGTVFGKHGVNIAQMAVGRDAPGGLAIGILNLDGEPSAEALAEIRSLPAIHSALVVRLPEAGELPSWLQA
jgi:D-3-phosphoglycerate dehydrogenase